jgi:hypothetical protein
MRYTCSVVVLTFITAALLHAQPSPGRSEDIQEFVRTSSATNFGRTLTGMHTIIAWALAKPPLPDALVALAGLEERSFPADTITAHIQQACEARYNPAHFEEIIAWFQSPLGTKVSEAEHAATLLDDSHRDAIRREVRSQWVSERRMLLLRRLDDNLALGSRQGTYALVLLEDIIGSVNRENSDQGKWSEDQVQRKLQDATTRLESRLRDSVLFEMRVTYRTLSNNDLQGYNEFLESPSGRWYIALLQQGIEDAFLEGRDQYLKGLTAIPLRLRKTVVP